MNEQAQATEEYMLDIESGESVRDLEVLLLEGQKFIDDLPNATISDRAWNKQDMAERLKTGESLADLKEKYVFYDGLRKLIDDTLANMPESQRKKILPVIEAVVNEETNGNGREKKQQKLEFIRELVVEHRENQEMARFKVALGTLNPTKQQILGILEEKSRLEFKKNYESIYTSEFWVKAKKLSPTRFPGFSSVFMFNKESDFLKEMTLPELSAFTAKVQGSLVGDVMGSMDIFFGQNEKKAYEKDLNACKAGELTKIMSIADTIANKKEKNRYEALSSLESVQQELHTGSAAEAQKKMNIWEDTYGADSLVYLDQSAMRQKIEEKAMMVEALRGDLKSVTDPYAKRTILERLYKLEELPEHEMALSEVGADIAQLKKDNRYEKAQAALASEDLDRANLEANALVEMGDPRGYDLREQIAQKREEEKAEHVTDDEGSVETGIDKIEKRRFLESVIEHVQRVKEACDSLGIPTSDPNFWGEDGVKNRREWLEKNGLYGMYEKFDQADEHRPKSYGNYVTFRWVDVRTGPNLTGSRAKQGYEHMRKMEESGAIICALSAAFSLDYSSGETKCYDPDTYLDRIRSELASV